MELQIVRYDQTVATRWKNGLGEARQVASWPGELESFQWQISMASMTGKLPFSDYPGVDRSLCVIGGDGLAITSSAREVVLTRESDPLHFPGEEKIVGATIGSEEMIDFNVLTRRDVFDHQTHRLKISRSGVTHVAKEFLVLFAQKGTIAISCGDILAQIGEGDTAILQGVQGIECGLSSAADAVCLCADIFRSADVG